MVSGTVDVRDGDGGRTKGRSASVFALVGAVGYGLIFGGVALAVYSWFWASTRPIRTVTGQDMFGSFTDLDVSSLPARYAATTAIVGVLILAAMGVAAFASPRHRSIPWVARALWGAGLLVLPIMAIDDHLPGVWGQVRAQYPLFEQLPSAIAAGVLVVIGTALTSGVVWGSRVAAASGRLLPAVAVATGILVAVAVAVPAVGAGDDARHIDRSTAVAAPVAQLPQALGTQRYELVLPVSGGEHPDIVVAGAGFVTASAAGVTAYDGRTGAQRWHYLRTDTTDPNGDANLTYEPDSLRSLDGGSVVLARWYTLGWFAFDSMTGDILWQESEFTRDEADTNASLSRQPSDRSAPVPLILSNKDRIARYDARTGARMWSVNTADLDCTDAREPLAITDDAIYRMAGCEREGEPVATVTALDPDTGAALAHEQLPLSEGSQVGIDSGVTQMSNSVVFRWQLAGGPAWSLVNNPTDLARGAFVIDPLTPVPLAADATGARLFTEQRDFGSENRYVVTDAATGRPGFEVAPAYRAYSRWRLAYPAEQFLADEMVQIVAPESSAGVPQIRSWSRGDGQPGAGYAIETARGRAVDGVMVVPGSVLVVSSRDALTDMSLADLRITAFG